MLISVTLTFLNDLFSSIILLCFILYLSPFQSRSFMSRLASLPHLNFTRTLEEPRIPVTSFHILLICSNNAFLVYFYLCSSSSHVIIVLYSLSSWNPIHPFWSSLPNQAKSQLTPISLNSYSIFNYNIQFLNVDFIVISVKFWFKILTYLPGYSCTKLDGINFPDSVYKTSSQLQTFSQ